MRHDTTARLHEIAAPTLVITGDGDRLIPSEHSSVLAEKIPGARLETLAGGTHGFNLEMPDAFNHAILSFLATT
jgi:3-oxoadipate enol-lactonase